MTQFNQYNSKLEKAGFALIPALLDAQEITFYQHKLASLPTQAGIRDITRKVPEILDLAQSPKILTLMSHFLGNKVRLVRALYFNKTPETNWQVAWHQDLTIEMQKKVKAKGFDVWSVKEGKHYVQAPTAILQKMLTLRLHLDPTHQNNGALKVIPTTHQLGRISAAKAIQLAKQMESTICSTNSGDGLLFRPLLIHASNKSTSKDLRRILHFEYAANDFLSL
jgi:ectoine hydroxylase-related dioxygenase (phytanoyl-CoA dioxygenase family)